MSALHGAVMGNDPRMLTTLLATPSARNGRRQRKRADRRNRPPGLEVEDDFGRTPLCYAVELERTDMVRALLEAGADPSTPRARWFCSESDDTSPLLLAVRAGESEALVGMLLAAGANVNYRRSTCQDDPDDASALDVALAWKQWGAVLLLVEAGVDVLSVPFRSGIPGSESPLMTTAYDGPSELVELMLEKGADPNYVVPSHYGGDADRLALHCACGGAADPVTVRLLCDWGADVNAVFDGQTPLHIAVGNLAPPAAVSALVVAGADPFVLSEYGSTVVEDMGREDVLLDSRPFLF